MDEGIPRPGPSAAMISDQGASPMYPLGRGRLRQNERFWGADGAVDRTWAGYLTASMPDTQGGRVDVALDSRSSI